MIKQLDVRKINLFTVGIVNTILLLFISFSLIAQEQTVEVQRSTNKVMLNGKIFYTHTVKKGETLYAIAKAYNVKVEEILSANPSAINEIKVDQVLWIPENPSPVIDAPEKLDGQIIHVVTKGQTLFSIARIYGITVADLEKSNPVVKYDSLQVNQVLKIPLPQKLKVEASNNFIIHTVEPKETLYSLSKKYYISQDEILKLNDNVAKEGLKIGQEIKIPNSVQHTEIQGIKTDTSAQKNPFNQQKTIQNIIALNCDSLKEIHSEQPIDIALLIPLFTGETENSDQVSSDDTPDEVLLRQTEDFNPTSMNYIEFYQGILLALDGLKNKGFKVNLHVFDTKKGINKIDSILKTKDFQKCNLIIGPIYPDQIKIVAEYALKNKIYIVSPSNTQEDVLNTNPYFIQTNPGTTRELLANLNDIKPNDSTNIVVVYNGSQSEQAQNKIIQTEIKNHFDTTKIKEVTVFDYDFTEVKSDLDSLKTNYVITPVLDEIFITNLLGIIESKLVYFNVNAYGFIDWTMYKVEINYFFDLQLVYNSPYYVDYNSEATKTFLKKYRFFFLPNRFGCRNMAIIMLCLVLILATIL